MLQLLFAGFKSWLRRPSTWIPLLLAGLIVASSQALTTCHTKPAGLLTTKQAGQLQAQNDKALWQAATLERKAAHAAAESARLRYAAQHYDSLATYYANHAPPVSTPAADSSGLARFWATLFGR